MLIAGLVALIAAQALKKAFDASDLVLIVLLGGDRRGVAALLWLRAEPVRSFLNILSPAPLVFLALFLFSGSISELAFPDEAQARTIGGVTQAPIVVVLLDELPVEHADRRGRQARRGALPGLRASSPAAPPGSRTPTPSTTPPSAPSRRSWTATSPSEDHQPISGDHPNSIFSLFGKTHRMNVSEEATSVCSRDLCEDERLEESYGSRISSMAEDLGLVWLHVVSPPEIETELPSVSENWGNFGGGRAEEAAPETGQRPRRPRRARAT